MSESMPVQEVSNAPFSHPPVGKQAPARATSRGKQQRAPARLPMLDWPADLFSDSATMVELISEEYPMCLGHPGMALAA